MRVLFRNLETAGQALDCTVNIPRRSKEGKPLKGIIPHKLHFEHGHEYDLPDEVVEHLNSLSYPLYKIDVDPLTGQTRHVRAGNQNRFWLQPVDLAGQIRVADQQAAAAAAAAA